MRPSDYFFLNTPGKRSVFEFLRAYDTESEKVFINGIAHNIKINKICGDDIFLYDENDVNIVSIQGYTGFVRVLFSPISPEDVVFQIEEQIHVEENKKPLRKFIFCVAD